MSIIPGIISSRRRSGGASDWTEQTSSFGTSDINAVYYGSDSVWVAVGADSKLASATSAVGTWTQRTSNLSGSITDVREEDGDWLSIGASGANSYATDPESSWTAGSQQAGGKDLYCIATNTANSNWLIGNKNVFSSRDKYYIYLCTDITAAWTSLSYADCSDYSACWATSVVFGGNHWLFVTNTGRAFWNTNAIPTSATWLTSKIWSGNARSVDFGNGYWVAVGDAGKLYYSSNPTAGWTANTSHPFGTDSIRAVKYINGTWIAASATGEIATTDATNPTGTWALESTASAGIYTLGYDGTYVVAAGEDGLLQTTDKF